MILSEILTKPGKGFSTTDRPTDLGKIYHSKDLNVAGYGYQTIAYLHKKFPGKIIRVTKVSGYDDPSYQFIRVAYQHQNNPWFPKIYHVKFYAKGTEPEDYEGGEITRPNFANTLIVVMEKLDRVSVGWKHLGDLGITREMYHGVLATQIHSKVQQHYKDDPMELLYVVVRKMFQTYENRNWMYKNTTNSQLKQALKLLEPIFTNYEADVHSSNIRQRAGGQLVFIDPASHTTQQYEKGVGAKV